MSVRKTLRPGQPGTKKLCNIYGGNLLTVRYIYDEVHQRRYKTVELIVDEGSWIPSEDRDNPFIRVYLRIPTVLEAAIDQVKAEGGIFNPYKRLWKLELGKVRKIGLESFVTEILPYENAEHQ